VGKDSKLKIDGLYIVGAFLLLAFFFWSQESDAIELEVGPTLLSNDYAKGGMLLLTERQGKWSFGGGYVSEQYADLSPCVWSKCTWDIEPNLFFQVQRIVDYKNWELGVGPAYFQNTNRALGKNLTWTLSLGYKGDRWALRLRHYSNAGSGVPNMGQDALTIGYSF